MSPELAGGFLTTAPPGKPPKIPNVIHKEKHKEILKERRKKVDQLGTSKPGE